MKSLIKTTFLMTCLLALTSTQAQFLKKLGDKMSDAAENTVTRKSADKTSREVGKGMDGIFSSTSRKERSKIAKPDSRYKFDYHYQMEMTSEENAMQMDYYFKPNSNYAGMAMNQQGMKIFMVFDYNKSAAYSFMEGEGQKMYTPAALDLETANDWANNTYTKSDYTVTELPNKSFLGYSCQGRQIENDEWKFTMYYTDEVEVGFQNILNASTAQDNNPSVLREYFKDAENAMMMYMETVDKKHRGDASVTMECVAFEKANHDFKTNGYQAISY